MSTLRQLLLGIAASMRRTFKGQSKPARRVPSPPRNKPCPCGSRKKFKACCARKNWPAYDGRDPAKQVTQEPLPTVLEVERLEERAA